MILFVLTIKEAPDGKVRFTVQTPAGRATLREMDVAREFQQMVTKLQSGEFKTTVLQNWTDANNPNRQ